MMKKRILLALLPAAMALAACSGIQSSPKQANLMLEDTVAHEEVFGAADEIGDLRVTRMNPSKRDFPADFIKMGYQIKFDEGGEGTADDKISIRFIAAIKDSNVKAFWHRGFAQPNGYEGANVGTELVPNWRFKLNDAVVNESTKIYSALNNGGGSSITANVGDYDGYEGFIIYSLLNIPYETYKDSYLGAYVEVVDPADEFSTQKSKFLAVKVEKEDADHSKNAFAVPSTYLGKHFLQGTINGSVQSVLEDETIQGTNNYASYSDLDLLADDSFGSYYLSTEHFQLFGHSNFFNESASYFEASSLVGYNKPYKAGNYTLFVSAGSGEPKQHENCVYAVPNDVDVTFTFTPSENWKDAGAVFYLYGFNDSGDPGWYKFTETGEAGVYSIRVEHWSFTKLIYVRKNPSNDEGSWTGKWNQSGNIDVNFSSLSYVMSAEEWW